MQNKTKRKTDNMKKLLIAAAVAVFGIAAHAASLNWSTWGYINDGSQDSDWITGGQAYLVQATDAATFAIANDLTITGGSIVDSAALGAGTVTGAWNGTESLVDGQTYKFAMIVTDQGTAGTTPPTTGVYGVDDNSGALYSVVWNASTGSSFAPDDLYEGASISTAVAVPEPTSGLLLLLGMAGLALKRKRA